jgi:hypothetical protein
MNIKSKLIDLGSIDALIAHGSCNRVGQFNDTKYYHFSGYPGFIAINKNNEDYDFIDTGNELIESVKSEFNFVFKKQPILADLCIEIFKFQLDVYGDQWSLLFSEKRFRSLAPKLLNKDIMKHIKNSGYNIKDVIRKINDGYSIDDSIPANFEDLDDKIEEIILNQKAKKFIQKIYSEKYKHLADERTIRICKNFVLKDISISIANKYFGSKIAKYKNKDEANEGLNILYKELTGWTKKHYLQVAKDMNIDVIKDDGHSLCLKIRTYEQSKEQGSGQWCLSYDKDFFKQYKGVNNSIFFNYDFSQDPDQKNSLVGLVVDTTGTLLDGYWRDDTSVHDPETDELVESLSKFKSMLPSKYTIVDKNNNLIDSANLKETMYERTLFLFDYCYDMEGIDILMRELDNNRLDLNLGGNNDINRHLLSLYECANLKESDDIETVILKKKTLSFVKKYLNNSESFSEKSPDLFRYICEVNDVDMMVTYIKNTDSSFKMDILLNNEKKINSVEGRCELIEMVKNYKETHVSCEPFRAECLFRNLLLIKDEVGNPDVSFIKDIMIINNGKINIESAHRYLDPEFDKCYGKDLTDHKKNISLILKTVLKNIDVKKLESDFKKTLDVEKNNNPFFVKIKSKISQSSIKPITRKRI